MEDPSDGPASLVVPAWQYVAALVAYVVLSLIFKVAFLNWIVGPLFMVAAIDIVPRALGRSGAGRSDAGGGDG